MATPESATPAPARARISTSARAAVPRLLVATFPYLPTPARVASTVLAVAVIAATALAWIATLGGAGITSGLRPVPLFAALVLTGATIAAAVLPRYAYSWLESRDWFPGGEGFAVAITVLGAHVILGSLELTLLGASVRQPSGAIMAGVSAVGTVLWIVHEALRAYAVRQLATD